jgi:alkyl hydroperoxide reductase subunit AhpC
MSIRLGDIAPNFKAHTTQGDFDFHQWIGDAWAVLFSHPKDFTPVCTTELGRVARLREEFAKRNTKVLGLSIDTLGEHKAWTPDIEAFAGAKVDYPIAADSDLVVAKLYDMLPAAAQEGKRTAADNATVRSVFVIGPDKKVKASLVYPMSVGRNFDEILRLIDGLQLNAQQNLATPANWSPGEEAIIPASVSEEDARRLYPQGYRSFKPYLRFVQPAGGRRG